MPNELSVAPRQVLGKKVKALRRGGHTPANIFGHKIESTPVQADTVELIHLLREMSKNAIVNLSVEGESAPRTVVVRDVARDPLRGTVLHVDFFQVSMTERMRAEVPVVLAGTSEAVATYGGVLLQMVDAIAVEALPGDIPAEFTVDVSVMTELEQSVHVRDLAIDESKITVHTDRDVVVARVAAPRLATAEEEGAPAEGAEGAAPADGGASEPAAEPGGDS
jgi:large subunit ribosomal protein L25